MLPVVIALVVITFVFLWDYDRRNRNNPLSKLPGPRRRFIVGSALDNMNISNQELFDKIRQSFKEYGDRFTVQIFGRWILHVCAPDDIEIVLSHTKNITKSKPYSFLEPWLGTGLLLSTGSKWHKRRKILTPTFHFNILKNFSTVMQEKSTNLMKKLEEIAGKDVDVMAVMSDFTLYTICETAMGTQLDTDQSANTQQYKSAIQDIGKLMVTRLITVWLHNEFLYKNSALAKLFNSCLVKIHKFADDVIEKRRETRVNFTAALEGGDDMPKKRLAMLDLLLEAEDQGQIDTSGIKEEVNTFMFEGYDTTSVALTYALMFLAKHEDVQQRIFEECQSIMGSSKDPPTMVEWSKMKYLEAVIKETLRLRPSVPFIARTVTEEFMLGDIRVKPGSDVAVHIFDLHRRAELFPAPEQFRPERFLAAPPRHPYAYVPFSAGPRNCIGQKFAMLEMKCVLSDICRRFRLRLGAGAGDVPVVADLVLRPLHSVLVQFLPR